MPGHFCENSTHLLAQLQVEQAKHAPVALASTVKRYSNYPNAMQCNSNTYELRFRISLGCHMWGIWKCLESESLSSAIYWSLYSTRSDVHKATFGESLFFCVLTSGSNLPPMARSHRRKLIDRLLREPFDKCEASNFADSATRILDEIKMTDVHPVASYNWIDTEIPTMVVPGASAVSLVPGICRLQFFSIR